MSHSSFEVERDHEFNEQMRRACQQPPGQSADLPTEDPPAETPAGDSQADA